MANVSLTRDEAVRRAALVRVTGYDIELGLSEAETFRSRTVIGFTCATPGAATFVELADAIDVRARLNGAALPANAFEGNRIVLGDLAADNELVVEARLPCVTTGDGMNRYVDPADGATYLAAFCGMDLAQRVFACFDQPDLRAPISLSVVAPAGWTVLANGRAELTDESEEHGWWRFATTPAISTYLFVVCAGPWHSVVWERATPEGGIPFGWHARRSMAPDLDSAADELRQITDACFEHYTTIFDEPFVFDSYDQVMAPGLNWGAMETPGCVTYRDELLFQGQASPADRQRRAMIIAHEMAHMWFGDLVSVRWWEDAWLSESFADYMGFEVSSSVAGFPGAWASFTIRQKLGGYEADERRSTHPVAPSPESVVDVDTAFGNFDHISYSKGNSVVRQLVTWLGEETFLRGANAYLTRHRLGNADLGDFLDAMDEVTDRDVRSWSEVWLAATGFDTLRVRRDGDVPVLEREGCRPHRTLVGAYSLGGHGLVRHGERMLDIGADPLRLDDWSGLLVIPNCHDHTFARIRLDDKSWHAVVDHLSDIDDPQVRAVVWATALDMVHSGDLAPADLIAMIGTHLAVEEHSSVWEGVFDRTLARVLPGSFPVASVAVARAGLAETCAATLRAGRQRRCVGAPGHPWSRRLHVRRRPARRLAGRGSNRQRHRGGHQPALADPSSAGRARRRGSGPHPEGSSRRPVDPGRDGCSAGSRGPPVTRCQATGLGPDVRGRRVQPHLHGRSRGVLGARAGRPADAVRRPLPRRGSGMGGSPGPRLQRRDRCCVPLVCCGRDNRCRTSGRTCRRRPDRPSSSLGRHPRRSGHGAEGPLPVDLAIRWESSRG